MLTIGDDALAAMRAHAEEAFPEEACGVLFATPAGLRVRRMTNIQNRLHAADPARYPRDARTAYDVDPKELLEVSREADRPGWRIVLFYHSHPEHGAYFSATDKARALWGEGAEAEPSYPGVSYLVLSVYDRRVRDVQVYGWDDTARDFVALPFAPPA